MGLETILQPEGINIKDFTAQEPVKAAPPLPFDVLRDLPKMDVFFLREILNSAKNSQNDREFPRNAFPIQILFPEKADLLFEDSDFESLHTNIKENLDSPESVFSAAEDLMTAKVLFPDSAAHDISPRIVRRVQAVLDKRLSSDWKRGKTWNYMNNASMIHIISPDYPFHAPLFVDARQAILERVHSELTKLKEGKYYIDFLRVAADAKLLFGKDAGDLGVTSQDWIEMKKLIGDLRYPILYLHYSAQMKILTAEDVKITDKGIELIMQTPQPEGIKKVPEPPNVRKF